MIKNSGYHNPYINARYLVIDDFPDMRLMVQGILRSLGVPDDQIYTASNGIDALKLLEKRKYDVVLSDYNLGPGKDGQQILEEARYRNLLGVHAIFIMITAENTRDMIMGVVEHQPDSYLAKPFNKELLKNRLDKLFARKQILIPVNDALAKNQPTQALAQLDQIIASGPKNLSELLKLKAEIAISIGQYDQAAAIYNRILEERDLAWAHLGAGRILYTQKKYPEAQQIFEKLIQQNDALIPAYDWLAKCQSALGQSEEAEATLSKAVVSSPKSVRRQQFLGELALSNGHSDTAETAFKQAVRHGHNSAFNHPSLFSGLAKSSSANGNHKEAFKSLDQMEKRFPENQEACLFKEATAAVIHQNQGDQEAARACLEKAETILVDLDQEMSTKAGLEMAKALSLLNEKEKAAKLFGRVVANHHDNDELLSEVKQAFKEASFDQEEAAQIIHEARQSVIKQNNQGVRLISEGKLEAAVELLEAASRQLPDNRTINLNAAKAAIMLMERKGATESGVQQVEQYLSNLTKMVPEDWRVNALMPRLQALAQSLS